MAKVQDHLARHGHGRGLANRGGDRDCHGAGEWPESYAVTSGLWESENGPSKGEDRYHEPDGLAVKRASTKGIDSRACHEDT
jgi:hypothetical protein